MNELVRKLLTAYLAAKTQVIELQSANLNLSEQLGKITATHEQTVGELTTQLNQALQNDAADAATIAEYEAKARSYGETIANLKIELESAIAKNEELQRATPEDQELIQEVEAALTE
jgi:ABC-type amino acid transport substrate-binding protein